MALDVQRNWNSEMLQTSRKSSESQIDSSAMVSIPVACSPAREVHLPVEIILNIISFFPLRPSNQPTLWACALVSKTWYDGTISTLYKRPHLSSSNFREFVRTVCPSKNAHIKKSELAEMVQCLDMSLLSYDGSKSLTARILGRLKKGLKKFVAPQASFAINCFASLSKCTNLEYLNLSLISASISMKLLYQTLRSLKSLRVLFLPRSSNKNEDPNVEVFWPPNLHALHLAGGINDQFLLNNLFKLPKTLQTVSIQHCSDVYHGALELFMQSVGPQLRELKISHPMRSLNQASLNPVLSWCPNLDALRISVELVCPEFLSNIPAGEHPLRILDLDCSGDNILPLAQFSPALISKHLTQNLTSLRSIRVDAKLGWTEMKEETEDLSDELTEMDSKKPLGIEPGVWIF